MKNLFLGLIMLAGTASFANNNAKECLTSKTEINSVLTETTSVVKTSSFSNDDKWYFITKVTTHNYFLFGYWVGSSVDTQTTLVWIP
jgi:hypothetical protein